MYTSKASVVGEKMIEIIRENWIDLGLTDQYDDRVRHGVSFGSTQDGFPYLPVVYLDSIEVSHPYQGPTLTYINDFIATLVVCHADISKLNSEVRLESLQRAEKVRELFISNYLDGLLVDGTVISVRPRLIHFPKSIYFAHELSWKGFSKTYEQSPS